jgi:hypothetical protein
MEDVFAQLAQVMNKHITNDTNDPDCCDSRHSF